MRRRVVVGLSAIALVLGALGSVSYYYVTTPTIAKYEEVRRLHKSSDLILVDKSGQLLHQWRKDPRERSFAWVALSSVSSAFTRAVLKSEDQKFYDHSGVEFRALAASLYQRIWKGSSRGGSTISMQLVKLTAQDKAVFQGWGGKVRQIFAARRLESEWSKEQILEAYLNLVPFRGEYRGLPSAAWSLFEKSPSGLTLKEATLLAVLIRSPNAKSKDWSMRACWQEPSLCAEFKTETSILSQKNSGTFSGQHAIHLAQRLSKAQSPGEVMTTIRKDLQVYAQEVVQGQIRGLESQNVRDAAVLVIENSTGEVWSYVGGSGLHPETEYVDGVQALRQAGSTLKPFLYATAFEKNILHPDSWIEDSAVDIVFDRGIYKPQNHDRQFYGWVQVKTALGSSLNVPAVKVFKLLNDTSFWSKLQELHFRDLREPDHYGPALALGVADVTLEDLTQAYRTLANGGLYSSLRFFPGQSRDIPNTVFSSDSVMEVKKVLAENQNRALGFGLDSSLSVPGTSVKTGTSKDMRDNWCIGFDSRFTVGVWVGNFNGEPMWNVMGVTGAAPIWKKIMEKLQSNYSGASELVDTPKLVNHSSKIAPEEYPQVRILYPQDGMILALDPSIPSAHQKMPLLIQANKQKNLRWKIDGKKMVSADSAYLWMPTEGRHTFELYQSGELKQSVRVLVK